MFGWFEKKKNHIEKFALENPKEALLLTLLDLPKQAENRFRLGRDQEVIELLKSFIPRATRLLNTVRSRDATFHTSLFSGLLLNFDLLIRTRQIDIAQELHSALARSAPMIGGGVDYKSIVETKGAKLKAITHADAAVPSRAISVVYVCQHCGWLNCFITEPCMKCGFVARDKATMRLAMFLSNQYLHIKTLPGIGDQIARGGKLQDVLPDMEPHLAKVEIQESMMDTLILKAATKNRSSKFPNVESMAQCGHCTSTMKSSDDKVCHGCGKEIRLPAVQRFAIATFRAAESIQRMLAPKDSPEFGHLVCLLVTFEANAFQEGKVPTEAERADALKSMCALKYLGTRDGGIRVIFEANEIVAGVNKNTAKNLFTGPELTMLFDEWTAFHKYMREGVSLR